MFFILDFFLFFFIFFFFFFFFFFFNDPATTEIYTLSLHDALPSLHLVPSHPESRLDPLPPRAVLPHLRRANERGRPVRHRRGRAFEAVAGSWEAGAGAVLTCLGPAGLSAQAVVALGGHGEPRALRPPPGGAVVLRAWRLRRPGGPVGRAGEPAAEW